MAERIEQRVDLKIHAVESRLTDVLRVSLADISASQREMMAHLSKMTASMHQEAAYQRDVQRELHGRINGLQDEVRGGRASGFKKRLKEKEVAAEGAVESEAGDGDVPMAPGEEGGHGERCAPPAQELLVPTTPPRALRPEPPATNPARTSSVAAAAGAKDPGHSHHDKNKKKEERAASGGGQRAAGPPASESRPSSQPLEPEARGTRGFPARGEDPFGRLDPWAQGHPRGE